MHLVLIPEVLKQDGFTRSFENGNITEDVTDVWDKFRSRGGHRKETSQSSPTSTDSKADFGIC